MAVVNGKNPKVMLVAVKEKHAEEENHVKVEEKHAKEEENHAKVEENHAEEDKLNQSRFSKIYQLIIILIYFINGRDLQ